MVAATVSGEHGKRYPIGAYNMKYKKMIQIMYDAIDNKKKIFNAPTWISYLAGLMLNRNEKKHGREGGLHYAKLMTDIQSRDLYYSPELIAQVKKELGYAELGYNGMDVVEDQGDHAGLLPRKVPSSDPAHQVQEDRPSSTGSGRKRRTSSGGNSPRSFAKDRGAAGGRRRSEAAVRRLPASPGIRLPTAALLKKLRLPGF